MTKLLVENIGKSLDDFGFGDKVLHITPKMKEQIYILDSIRIESFSSAKDRKMKQQKEKNNNLEKNLCKAQI